MEFNWGENVHSPFCPNGNFNVVREIRYITGGPDAVFDFGDYVTSSADKTIAMYESTLNTALNRTCIQDLNKHVFP